MIGALPPRPTGSDRAAIFFQWVWDNLQALRLQEVPGAVVHRTTRGQFSLPTVQSRGGTPAQTQIKSATIYGNYSDYFTTDSGELVAKPAELRGSETTYTAAGMTMTYSGFDLSTQTRTATSGSVIDIETIVRPYQAGQLVVIAKVESGTTGVTEAPEWIDLNIGGKHWAKKWA